MAAVTPREIFDLVVMIAAVGFIFKDYLRVRDAGDHDPIDALRRGRFGMKFIVKGLKTAVILTAPAIVLHELGHKITAIAFGLEATFHASYLWLAIGVFLKLLKVPLLFFVPGYVTYPATADPLTEAAIAFAGPLVNLILFAFAAIAIKQGWFDRKHFQILHFTKQINLFLFAFNLIPFGPFDGAHVFGNLINLF